MNVSWVVHTITIGALALAACQKGDSGTVDTAYRADVTRICDAERLSGADQQPEGSARTLAIAQWLGSAIQTKTAQNFLAELTHFDGAAKGQRLLDEARRVGLDGCSLADVWK
jgi:hypothetical protein